LEALSGRHTIGKKISRRRIQFEKKLITLLPIQTKTVDEEITMNYIGSALI